MLPRKHIAHHRTARLGRTARSTHERGMILIVAMVMVLLMTIIGLAAIRGSGLQERMAGNVRDLQMRFQAAEAGLRAGEQRLEVVNDDALPQFDVPGVPGFLTNRNMAGLAPVFSWNQAQWDEFGLPFEVELNMPLEPLFVVEEITVHPSVLAAADGSGVDAESQDNIPPRITYRVTSRYGVDGQAIAVQSIYKR